MTERARLRYVTGDVVTEAWPKNADDAFTRARMDLAREHLGARMDASHYVNGWTYGFGALRHIEYVRESQGHAEPWTYSETERASAESASFRATLALLRAFRCYPVRRFVWLGARQETTLRVEISLDEGPWREVDGRGLPVTP